MLISLNQVQSFHSSPASNVIVLIEKRCGEGKSTAEGKTCIVNQTKHATLGQNSGQKKTEKQGERFFYR